MYTNSILPVLEIAALLEELRAGNRSALNGLAELLYPELRRIAQSQLRRERPDHTLQPTALVHETYLRLMHDPPAHISDRAHLLAVASQVMRRILVEHARARLASRRGGQEEKVPFDSQIVVEMDGAPQRFDLLELDLALQTLERENHPLAQVVEMRYFGGMTAAETAEVLGESVYAVEHRIRLARAWLRRELSGAC